MLLPSGREVKLWVKPQYGAKMGFPFAPYIITLGVISATEIPFVWGEEEDKSFQVWACGLLSSVHTFYFLLTSL